VAKFDADIGAFSRRDVLKVRRRVLLTSWKGRPLIRKWPKQRGPVRSPLQKLWTDRFALLARELKSVDPITLSVAQNMSLGTGWYYRDVLETAAYGKLIRYQDEPRVTTPTVHVSRSTAESMVANIAKRLTPNQFTWDNNVFWSSTVQPARLTVKAPGLYLCGANVFGEVSANVRRGIWMTVNDSIEIANSQFSGGVADIWRQSVTGIYYFHANDFLTLWAATSSSAQTARLHDFWMVAITPEGLIP